jgi:hypothetical protein
MAGEKSVWLIADGFEEKSLWHIAYGWGRRADGGNKRRIS